MRKTTRMTTTLAAFVGGAALLVSGCSGAESPTDTANGPGETTVQVDPVSGEVVTDAKAVSPCIAEDITVDLNPQPDRPADYLLALTNTSDQACEFGGTLELTPRNMANEPIDQVENDAVDHPGPASPITLESGRTAYAGVQVDLGDKADSDTYVASGFTATLPELDDEIQTTVVGTEGEEIQIPLTAMRVGTLQPITDGVLF